jgi:hypothetical protein
MSSMSAMPDIANSDGDATCDSASHEEWVRE